MKILVVDDEENLRALYKEYLERDGHDVLTATDSTESFYLLNKNKFDVMVLDINLSGLSGLDFLSYVKQSTHDLKVIVITGVPSKSNVERANLEGAFDYLEKPISREKLINSVNRARKQKD